MWIKIQYMQLDLQSIHVICGERPWCILCQIMYCVACVLYVKILQKNLVDENEYAQAACDVLKWNKPFFAICVLSRF